MHHKKLAFNVHTSNPEKLQKYYTFSRFPYRVSNSLPNPAFL